MSEMSAIGKRSGIADLLAVFFLPLAANLSASLLLKLVPGAETALRFNALCQGCLLLLRLCGTGRAVAAVRGKKALSAL